MRFLFKFVFGSVLVLLGIAGVSYLQSRFDTGDEKKALQAIYAKRPDLVSVGCRAAMISRVRGIVRIECGREAWTVDVLKGTILESWDSGESSF